MSDTPELEPRTTPIAVGDDAPRFVLPAIPDEAEQFDAKLNDYIAKGPVLLVFYQDDGMPICTRELNVVAQEYATLERAGVQVLGLNSNGLGSHRKFQERDHFPFALISDFHGEAIKAYGFWDEDERKSHRGFVIVGTDGKVSYVMPHYNPGNVNGLVEVFEALGLA